MLAGLGVLLVVTFVIVALVTRGDTPSEDKSLTVYLPFDEAGVYEKISADFLANNPGVELTFKFIDAKDAKEYEAQVVNEIADGAGPDIWLVRSDWIPKHAAKSVPLETADGSDPIASAKTVIEPALVDLNTYNGKLYGVPLFGDSLAMIYNLSMYNAVADSAAGEQKTALEKFPATWDIVKSQAAAVTQKRGNVITRSGLAVGTVETGYAPVDVLAAALVQNGASILTEDNDAVAFNLAQFKNGQSVFPATDALSLFTSFARPSEANYSWNNDLGDAVEAFKSQKAGAIIGYYSLFRQLSEEVSDFDVAVAALPQLEDKGDRVDYGVTWSHIVNNQSASPALAWQYLTYLGGRAVQDQYKEETGKIAVNPVTDNEVVEQAVIGKQGADKVFRAQLGSIRGLSKPEWQAIDEILQDTVKNITNAGQSIQAAVDSAAVRFKDLIPNV